VRPLFLDPDIVSLDLLYLLGLVPCEECLIVYQLLFFAVLLCEYRHGYGHLRREFFSGRSLLG
jgi:hypothetical protein